ncbi:MAG TPA: ABC transporter permease [Candidatus Angelobacter sp.]
MQLLKRLQRLFRPRKVDSDLNNELRFHLEKEVELNIARGMTAEEARRQALIAFGGVQQTREMVRRLRWTGLVEAFAQDLRYGGRMLRKSPGFTLACVTILALGIGMNAAIFSLIEAVLFRALPAEHPQELVLLRWRAQHPAKAHGESVYGDCAFTVGDMMSDGCSFSLPFLNQVRSQTNMLSGLAAFAGAPRLDVSVSSREPATVVENGEFVSGDFFPTLAIRAALGQLLGPADDTPASAPKVVLSDAYWKRAFAADPRVVGRTIRINTVAFTIAGVAEARFSGLTPGSQYDLWLPLASRTQLYPESVSQDNKSSNWWLVIVGRLNPGTPATRAQAAMTLLFRNQTLHGEKPLFADADEPRIELVPAQAGLDGARADTLKPLYVLMLAVGLVLLIACANIAGLLLARAAAREKEIAVRLALGARRGRLVRQLLTESLMLSFAGGALGLVVATWGARVINALSGAPNFTPHLDTRVLAFTAAVAILTGLLFGLAPAFRSRRVDVAPALKTGSADGRHRRTWWNLGNALVVMQVALAVVALVSAGFLVHTLANLKRTEIGFDAHNLLVFGVDPPQASYKGAQVDQLYRDLQEKFSALPGVTSVTYSWTPLLNRWMFQMTIHPPDTPETTQANAGVLPVGPKFFETMRIPFRMGQDFSAADFASQAAKPTKPGEPPKPGTAAAPAIVNEAFVKLHLHGMDPMGRHIEDSLPDDPKQPRGPGWRIIGVVSDAKYSNLRDEITPTIYVPSTSNAFFSIRSAGDPMRLVAAVRETVNRRDNGLAVYGVSTESERIDTLLFQERYLARLSAFFAMLALALACTGIYGLLSYEVTRRTRELGIRMALGAQRAHAIRLILSQGLLLALAGAAAGIAASLAVGRLFQSLVYKVRSADPPTLAAVSLLLLIVALAACYIPARRATRVDPLVALRYE